MKNCNKDRKKNSIMVVIIAAIFFIRIVNLDADIPDWGIVNYQPMDEGQYSMMALNKINYGSIRLDLKLEDNQFLTSAHIRNNVIGNFLVYLGLILFGDNYYGFRSSSILIGSLNFLLFCMILFKIKKQYADIKKEKWNLMICIGIVLTFIFDFVYTVACRVVETSIYRMFFLQLIIYSFLAFKDNQFYEQKGRYFIAGFLAVISVFAVYITNIFIVFALLVTILFYGISNGKKAFLNGLISFIAGCGIAYVFCDLYYNFVWGTSCIVNTMQIINDFSGVSGYGKGDLLTTILHFFASNSNLYNISFLFLTLLFLPMIVKKVLKEKNVNIFFLLTCIFMLMLQTIINEDYIVRKFIIIYPIMFYLIYYFFVSQPIDEIKEYFSKHKILNTVYSLISVCLCAFLVIYRLCFIENDTYKDFTITDKSVLFIQFIVLIIIELVIIYTIFKKKNCFQSLLNTLVISVFLGCILTNIYFDSKYVYLNNSYTEKNVMERLGKRAGEDYVYGIYSISFTLYNDIKPVVNACDIQGKEINDQNIRWYLDYSDYRFPEEILDDKSAEWNELEIYKRNFSTFGSKNSVSLYEIIH